MDTDDLTPMAYETIPRAFDVCQFLRSEIGASASEYKTEDEFLQGTAKLLEEILKNPRGYLRSWNLMGQIRLRTFVDGLHGVVAYINATLAIPLEQRGKPPFAN